MANRSFQSNLFLNIEHVCAVRNIDRPFTFLRSHGFTHNTASQLVNNEVKEINLAYIEKLCLIFNCTPNDLFDYKLPADGSQSTSNPLTSIIKTRKPVNFNELLRDMPIDQLKEIEEEIRKRKG